MKAQNEMECLVCTMQMEMLNHIMHKRNGKKQTKKNNETKRNKTRQNKQTNEKK